MLNLIGNSSISVVKVPVNTGNCSATTFVCSANVSVSLTGRTYVYLFLPNQQTSYFAFMKGLRYADVFNTNTPAFSDNRDCYPIATINDFNAIYAQMQLDAPQPLLDKLNAVSGKYGNTSSLHPCGVKAAFFHQFGRVSLSKWNSTSQDWSENVSMQQHQLVDQAYLRMLRTPDDSYVVDTTQGLFLSWYLPQIPGFVTKIFYAVLPDGLSGDVLVSFDASTLPSLTAGNTYFSYLTFTPIVVFVQVPDGVATYFSNFTFGVFLVVLAPVLLLLYSALLVFLRRQEQKSETAAADLGASAVQKTS